MMTMIQQQLYAHVSRRTIFQKSTKTPQQERVCIRRSYDLQKEYLRNTMPIIYLKLPFKLNAEKIDPYLNCRQKILLIQACFIMREMCYSSSLNFFHDILLKEIHSRNVNQCFNLHMVSGMKYTFVFKLKQAQRRTCRKLGMSVKRCFCFRLSCTVHYWSLPDSV